MHVGMGTIFQNPQRRATDHQVYRDELRLADLAEPLGFESIWGVEHHFPDYTMCPDVIQFLSYMAGRTERANLGSMVVVVVPWHDPMRVAEEVSMLVIPQKPWEEAASDLSTYREVYRQANASEAPPPIVAAWTFCDENAERAYQMARRYIGGYWHIVMDHYEFKNDHLKNIKGYEYYGNMTEKVVKYGDDMVMDFFINLQVWGTPEQCYQKIVDIQGHTGNDSYVGVFSYAGMPPVDAEQSMRLFASEVMPQLKKLSLDR